MAILSVSAIVAPDAQYNLNGGSFVVAAGQYFVAVAQITGTQQIVLQGGSRLQVI